MSPVMPPTTPTAAKHTARTVIIRLPAQPWWGLSMPVAEYGG